MKKNPLALFLLIAASAVGQSPKPVKIVFDVTSNDTLIHQATLRHVTAMAEAYPKSTFEVVIYGGAIAMVQNGKSSVAKSIQKLERNPNVSFKVCEATMKRYNI